ncbi:inositol polyphosphate kinase kcs1, partial [Ancistrocladus abbreviatus]
MASTIELDKERLTGEIAFTDVASAVIKIRPRLGDFLQSFKLKYVKFGYGYTCKLPTTGLLFLILAPLSIATLIQLTGPGLDGFCQLCTSRRALVDTAAGLAGLFVLLLSMGLNWAKTPRPVYLVDFACCKPEDKRKLSVESFLKVTEECGGFEEETIRFQKKTSRRSWLGDERYSPPGPTSRPPDLTFKQGRSESASVIFSTLDALVEKTGINPEEIDILIVNCSSFNPTPSLCPMI